MSATRRRVGEFHRVWRPRYEPIAKSLGLSLSHMAIPLTLLSVANEKLIHTVDFLPDSFSFAGVPFDRCPQVDFAQRYLKGRAFDYEETDYYRLACRGLLPFPCYGAEQAHGQCRRFIYLIDRLRAEGYDPVSYDPISVARCRNGSVMVVNGKHRLAALIALEIRELPAMFCFEEELRAIFQRSIRRARPRRFYRRNLELVDSWRSLTPPDEDDVAKLICDIRKAKLETWADLYHPLPFAAFRGLTTQVTEDTPYRRLGMILREYNDVRGLRVLDLGCNVGFFSFALARRGAKVAGFDRRAEYVDIARKTSVIYGVPVSFREALVTPELVREQREVDLTLCFSMLQWLIRQNGVAYGDEVLRAISKTSNALFFDVSVNEGKACLCTEKGRELSYVHELLRRSTSYRQIRWVGDVHPYGSDVRHVFYCHH